jgi:hypothetical protein
MRHRIVTGTGFGNSAPVLLDNKGTINALFALAALKEYFGYEEGFDFQINKNYINIGREPGYQYERLKIISIHKDKDKSYIQTGKAWGPYGSQIVQNKKHYGEYKYNSKFVKFVDKWHEVLFGKKK